MTDEEFEKEMEDMEVENGRRWFWLYLAFASNVISSVCFFAILIVYALNEAPKAPIWNEAINGSYLVMLGSMFWLSKTK